MKDLGTATDPRRLDHFTEVIRSLSCDILGIQEGYSVEYMRTIGHRLGLNVVHFASSTRYPGGILTRFPILESRMFNHAGVVNQNMPFSRFGGASLLPLGDTLVWVVNFHAWPHDEEMRKREAEIPARQLDQLIPSPLHHRTRRLQLRHRRGIRRHPHGTGTRQRHVPRLDRGHQTVHRPYLRQPGNGRLGCRRMGGGVPASSATSEGRGWANSDHQPTIVELALPK